MRTLISDLGAHVGQPVTIDGWIDVARQQGKMAFFDFRDRTGMVQGVVFGKPELLEVAKDVKNEFVVRVDGIVNKRPEKNIKGDAQNGDIELEITAITVLAKAEDLPFEREAELNIDTLLDFRPYTLRRERERAIFKVQSEILNGYRAALIALGFTEFQAPKIVGDDAEGGAGVFKLDYLRDKTAYLATSPQLYKQIMVGVYERVFATGTTFRAEKHATTRHLNELIMLDGEMAFIESQYDVMAVIEQMFNHITAHLTATCAAEFKTLGATLPACPATFPHMSLREAQKLIREATGEDCTNEPDLDPAHERWLCEWALREKNSDFIFITGYPITKRPFYTMEDPANPGFSKCFDLLFRGVEISSGNQRVHEYEKLVEKMKWKGLDPANFSFYLQAFKYGIPPHGGWGMGLERITQKYLGLDNVKEASLFPRDINRIDNRLSRNEDQNAE